MCPALLLNELAARETASNGTCITSLVFRHGKDCILARQQVHLLPSSTEKMTHLLSESKDLKALSPMCLVFMKRKEIGLYRRPRRDGSESDHISPGATAQSESAG